MLSRAADPDPNVVVFIFELLFSDPGVQMAVQVDKYLGCDNKLISFLHLFAFLIFEVKIIKNQRLFLLNSKMIFAKFGDLSLRARIRIWIQILLYPHLYMIRGSVTFS